MHNDNGTTRVTRGSDDEINVFDSSLSKAFRLYKGIQNAKELVILKDVLHFVDAC